MLYALAHPAALGVLLGSLVLGLTAHGWVQAAVAGAFRDRRPRMEGRLTPDPRPHLEPLGLLGAAVSGLGWTKPVILHDARRRAALWAVCLAGPAVNVAAGVALLVTWRAAYGPGDPLAGGAAYLLQHGAPLDGPSAVLLLAGASQLYLGALSLVPLPPLDGGRLLFGLAPRTHGWRRAEHELVERNIGVAVLLALLLIPLGGPVPLLPNLLDSVLSPVLRLLTGG